jgi:hypothetical protein
MWEDSANKGTFYWQPRSFGVLQQGVICSCCTMRNAFAVDFGRLPMLFSTRPSVTLLPYSTSINFLSFSTGRASAAHKRSILRLTAASTPRCAHVHVKNGQNCQGSQCMLLARSFVRLILRYRTGSRSRRTRHNNRSSVPGDADAVRAVAVDALLK